MHDKKFDGIHFLPVLKRIVEEIEKDPKQSSLPKPDTRAKVEVSIRNSNLPTQISD